jgi:hypothetical protein
VSQSAVPPAAPAGPETKTNFHQTRSRSAPTTVPFEPKLGTRETAAQERGIHQPKTQPPSSAKIPKPVELSDAAQTPPKTESTVTDFTTPETKAMFDEIASRLQMAKQNQTSESGSETVRGFKDCGDKRNSDLENAAQAALESLCEDRETPGSTRSVSQTVPMDALHEPPAHGRSTPKTETRSSTQTEVFESPMPSDTAGDSTDLPSNTSISASSETRGLEKENLQPQETPARRRAKTVDLRELKKQLSGKIKGDKKSVEQSIADTIRECDRDDETANSRTSSTGKPENLSEQIARLTKSITESWSRNDEGSSDSSVEGSEPADTKESEG